MDTGATIEIQDDFKSALDACGMTEREAEVAFCASPELVSAWVLGKAMPPMGVLLRLTLMGDYQFRVVEHEYERWVDLGRPAAFAFYLDPWLLYATNAGAAEAVLKKARARMPGVEITTGDDTDKPAWARRTCSHGDKAAERSHHPEEVARETRRQRYFDQTGGLSLRLV